MSLAYHPKLPVVLYGSEAEAVAVPIDEKGRWLPERIDLDTKGEVVRIGYPRPLLEGNFTKERQSPSKKSKSSKQKKMFKFLQFNDKTALLLESGIEIRFYSLKKAHEYDKTEVVKRSVSVLAAPVPYDSTVDLVAEDLKKIPAVLSAIDRGKLFY